jgi:sporulation protein YlmC with PRC-barrel domain
MKPDYLEMARQVLDRQVVDANNVPCGKVDDVQLEGGAGKQLKIKAILIGHGAAADRLPELARWIVRKVLGKRTVAVPWKEVAVITNRIKLRKTAAELKLDEGRSAAFKVISVLPGAWKK